MLLASSRQLQSHGINFATSYEETIPFTSISFAIFFHHSSFFAPSSCVPLNPRYPQNGMKQKLHILCRCFIARCYAVRIPSVSCDGKRMQHSVKMRMKMIGMPKIETGRVRKKAKEDETRNTLNFVISRTSSEFSCIESKWNFRSNEHSRLILPLSLSLCWFK